MVITRGHDEMFGMVHDIKAWNIRNMMLYLLSYGNMTKMDMMQLTGLSTTTVSDTINALMQLGVLSAVGTQKSTGGRQAVLYGIHDDYGAFLGITLEPDALHMALCNMRSEPLDQETISIVDGDLLQTLYAVIERTLLSVNMPPLIAIGLGVSGRVAFKQGIVLEGFDIHWHNVPIKEILERKFGIMTFVDNLSYVGAVYQQVLGHAKRLESALCYFSRIPQRAALIMDGRICRGERDSCMTISDGVLTGSTMQGIMEMLGITKALTDVTHLFDLPCVQPIATPAFYFEISSALYAQIKWFEQLYAIHATPSAPRRKTPSTAIKEDEHEPAYQYATLLPHDVNCQPAAQ